MRRLGAEGPGQFRDNWDETLVPNGRSVAPSDWPTITTTGSPVPYTPLLPCFTFAEEGTGLSAALWRGVVSLAPGGTFCKE